MPRLIVKLTQQRSQVFALPEGETLIGRSDDADLQLPNVSVSREHARIVRIGGRAVLHDLDAQNGTLVNGKVIQDHVLSTRDELRIGRFTLIYLEDGVRDRFWKGRLIDYLPAYSPATLMPDQGATYQLSPAAIEMMQRNARAVEHARLIDAERPTHFWFPEEGGLTFGGGALIPVRGWLTWGEVAALRWNGRQHVIHRHTWRAPVHVNGEPIRERPLNNGDLVRVGGSRFLYERPR
ncbi:MAG: FHA domain-containing protein [Alphaproteobacteria bacterium]|nr:FHA domain-containing protein [Alphaproteobacteria bacterium]